jgi:hypothetical protein
MEKIKRPVNVDMMKIYQNYVANVYERTAAADQSANTANEPGSS